MVFKTLKFVQINLLMNVVAKIRKTIVCYFCAILHSFAAVNFLQKNIFNATFEQNRGNFRYLATVSSSSTWGPTSNKAPQQHGPPIPDKRGEREGAESDAINFSPAINSAKYSIYIHLEWMRVGNQRWARDNLFASRHRAEKTN